MMGKIHTIRALGRSRRGKAGFWVACVFLILVFLTGGGSRSDVQSLLLLRPASVLVLGYALWSLSAEQVKTHLPLLLFAGAVLLFIALQLVPLPPAIWHALPGRQIVSEVDAVAGIGEIWRPLSLVPSGTWNALFAILVPLSLLFLGLQLSSEDLRRLASVVVCAGIVSALVSVLQILGSPDNPLYFYRITNQGAAVGLFANRNHEAIFLACLYPLLALVASTQIDDARKVVLKAWSCGVVGAVLVPLILITGSRGGLFLGFVGICFAALLYRSPIASSRRKGRSRSVLYLLVGGTTLALVAVTALFSNAEAVSRLMAAGQGNDTRFNVWGPILDMGRQYFPVGSGIGSFQEVYQMGEPLSVLSPRYLNHAHNDWLELYMTGGVAAILLLVVFLFWYLLSGFRVWRVWRSDDIRGLAGRAGSVVILLLALGSIVDYPLRVPSLSCIAVVAVLWLSRARAANGKESRGDIKIMGRQSGPDTRMFAEKGFR